MKPRTKFERKVVGLQESLPESPEGMTDWVLEDIIDPIGFIIDRNSYYCGCCGKKVTVTEPCEFCKWKRFNCTSSKHCYILVDIRKNGYPVYAECPHCLKALKMIIGCESERRTVEVCALTTHGEVQLLRSFKFAFEFTKKAPMKVKIINTCNRWFSEKGIVRTTRLKNPGDSQLSLMEDFNYRPNVDFYHWRTRQEPRNFHCSNLFPEMELAHYLEVRGLKNITSQELEAYNNHDTEIFQDGNSFVQLIKYLIKFPLVEILIKKRDFETLDAFLSYNTTEAMTVYPSWLIARRHGYKPSDIRLWIDMVLLYHKSGKDIRNPLFICPPNLQQGHLEAQNLYDKISEREDRRRHEEWERNRPRDIFWFLEHNPEEMIKCVGNNDYLYQLNEIFGGLNPQIQYEVQLTDQSYRGGQIARICEVDYNDNVAVSETDKDKRLKHFVKLKGRFFNMAFSDDELEIRSLDSLDEYKEEGIKMHNCIESNGYAFRPDSLILSVRKGEKIVAHVELSLITFKIIQCWGPMNRKTPYHKKIEELIEKNIPLIRERLEEKLK